MNGAACDVVLGIGFMMLGILIFGDINLVFRDIDLVFGEENLVFTGEVLYDLGIDAVCGAPMVFWVSKCQGR